MLNSDTYRIHFITDIFIITHIFIMRSQKSVQSMIFTAFYLLFLCQSFVLPVFSIYNL